MREEHFQPIHTPIGIVGGRDAIYLDSVQFNLPAITLTGAFNGMLASERRDKYFYNYSLTFSGVQGFQMIALECSDPYSQSSFDEVAHSTWLSHLQANAKRLGTFTKDIAACKHYILRTYDDLLEIICSHFELTIDLATVVQTIVTYCLLDTTAVSASAQDWTNHERIDRNGLTARASIPCPCNLRGKFGNA